MDDDRIIGCLPGGTPASIIAGYQALQNARLQSALTAAQARIEKLERMVVWTAQESPCCCKLCTGDGTPASILAAVEKAMGEK